MTTYPEWRAMWDKSGGWRPTVDDIDVLLTEIDRVTATVDALRRQLDAWKLDHEENCVHTGNDLARYIEMNRALERRLADAMVPCPACDRQDGTVCLVCVGIRWVPALLDVPAPNPADTEPTAEQVVNHLLDARCRIVPSLLATQNVLDARAALLDVPAADPASGDTP